MDQTSLEEAANRPHESEGVRRAPAGPSRAQISFREILEPSDVVQVLRLRHRVYFEEQHYGPARALRLDLTSHDSRSRVYGVFRGPKLVGSVRLVLRNPQPLAAMFQALRAVAESAPEEPSTLLPSEEAFDLPASLGAQRELIDGEIGRLVIASGEIPARVAPRVVIASLAAAQYSGCRLYLYSCATAIAHAYARVTKPRFVLSEYANTGIASDRFSFPKPTLAAVAAVEDSPFARTIEAYAALLRERRTINLSAAIEPPRTLF